MHRLLPCCRFVLVWLVSFAVVITCSADHDCGPRSYIIDNGTNITLESPGYPALYPDDVQCETNITGPAGSVLRFTYLDFDLERRASIFGKCHDQLKLQDVVNGISFTTSQILRCGRPELPVTIISRTNQVSVLFSSDESSGYRGYQIIVDAVAPRPLPISRFLSHYDVTPKVVETIGNWIPSADEEKFDVTTAPALRTSATRPTTDRYVGLHAILKELPVLVSYDTITYLTSIFYPEDYPSSASYSTKIRGPAGSLLEFNFVDFSVEESPAAGGYASCRYDFVTIEETTDDSRYRPLPDKKSKYCGTEGPRRLKSSSNEARLTFHSDDSNQDRGFNISVRAIRGSSYNFNLSAEESRTFTSPNFPLPYPRDTNLTFEFTAPTGYHFNFQPVSFGLEYDSICQYDSLTFKEFDPATNTYNRPLGRPYCGYNMPSLQSSTNKVAANFYTDSYLHHSGFNITVSAIRNTPTDIAVLGNGTMYITSPNYPDTYPTFTNLTYDIKALEGYVIVFETVAFNLEGPFSECPHDHVRFFERVNKRVTLLGSAYYCSLDGPDDLVSKTNHVKMVFQSDFSINHSGFNISAHATKPELVIKQSISSSPPFIVTLNAILFSWLVTFCYFVYENLH